MERPLLEKGCDVFIRHNNAIPILHKIQAKKESSFSVIVSSRKPFGFASNFSDFNDFEFPNSIKIYAQKKQGYVLKDSVIQNKQWIDKYKLFVPKAIGEGNMSKDWIKPIMICKSACCTETYLVVGPFDSKNKMENAYSYMQTKYFHFMLGLKKITQDTTKNVYQFVPLQDFSHPWTDEMLYEKYGLSEDEIAFIESMIKPME